MSHPLGKSTDPVLGFRHRTVNATGLPSPAQVRHAQSPTTDPQERKPSEAGVSPYLPHNFSVSTLLQETEKQALVRWWAGSGETVVVSRVLRACLEPPVDLLLLPCIFKSCIRKIKSCTSLEPAVQEPCPASAAPRQGCRASPLLQGLKEQAKLLHQHLLELECPEKVSVRAGWGQEGSQGRQAAPRTPGLGS